VESILDAVDYDLHGLAGIRLVGASARDAAAVRRQLGPLQRPLGGDPDILVRFVDRLPTSSPLRLLGLEEAGFTDDAFLVLRSKHKAPAKVEIAFSEIGERSVIVCEHGLPAVPLLVPILNMTVLAKGALPLHASAFRHKGMGVVATGWSKGGKTEALLAFASRGAEYVGDEWVYVSPDGQRVCGIPEPIRLWSWQLRQLPEVRAFVGTRARARLRALELTLAADRAARRAGRRLRTQGVPSSRVASLVERQLFVDVPPERLFGGLGSLSSPFDRLFLLVSGDVPAITVEPIDPLEVAKRMAFSLEHERLDFTGTYLKFRFAFPDTPSPLVERAREIEREALARLLSGKPAYVVHHPYPFRVADLYEAMSGYC
jgi:hypothetical protein